MSERASRTSVLLADDHPLVVRGLRDLIAGEPDFEVIAVASNGDGALLRIRECVPNIAILDVTMPGINGLEVLKRAVLDVSPVHVIVLTASITDEQVVEALAAGVAGILLKESAPEALIECMRIVASGGKWLPYDLVQPAMERQADRRSKRRVEPGMLTEREAEVVRLVSEGMSNKSIARRLNMSEGTVKVHLHHVYRKLQISNRTLLAAMAIGWRER